MKIENLLLKLALLGIAATMLLISTILLIRAFVIGQFTWTFSLMTLAATITLSMIFGFRVLYLLFQVVNLISRQQAFSNMTLVLVRKIKISILTIAIAFIGIMPVFYDATQRTDAPGLMFIGFFIVSLPFIAFVFSQIVEDLFRSAISLKAEHDLTI